MTMTSRTSREQLAQQAVASLRELIAAAENMWLHHKQSMSADDAAARGSLIERAEVALIVLEREALSLRRIRCRAVIHEARMNGDAPRPPTGADYELLFQIITSETQS